MKSKTVRALGTYIDKFIAIRAADCTQFSTEMEGYLERELLKDDMVLNMTDIT